MKVGDIVPLDGSMPALRPCRYCGTVRGRIVNGSGPHGNGVRCFHCNRHLGWLPLEADEDPIIDAEDIIDF